MSAKKTKAKKSPAAKSPAAKPKNVGAASAAAILGIKPSKASANGKKTNDVPKHIKGDAAKYYRNLMDLRDRLMHQMHGLAKESATEMESYSLHMGDSGTDNFDRDFALSLLSADQDAVYEIEEALKRLDKGTYGTCELTGKQIPRARLEAIPWTRFTVEAQAQLERDGAVRQKKLGTLGTLDTPAVAEADDDDEPEEKPAKEKE
ncbi:MAG: TraR/DksA C4-type zinc finger protein [Verrucomicrobia bacterium]|nr:TraR/DksA C4-type zinc finger protein [Verrucomicrobiota bacterium]